MTSISKRLQVKANHAGAQFLAHVVYHSSLMQVTVTQAHTTLLHEFNTSMSVYSRNLQLCNHALKPEPCRGKLSRRALGATAAVQSHAENWVMQGKRCPVWLSSSHEVQLVLWSHRESMLTLQCLGPVYFCKKTNEILNYSI